ncbi:unnamed protein product [Protopolystoma xenopodis]|uniref:Uncharacterized protein n=1 Tax=Protopolystoma xenopodis TaxID=117903 RepID=A0A3S5AA54_9PLAT|nr:unnamed protein product [Protopolystoma xenopodis]
MMNKFWTRNRPGDVLKETLGGASANALLQLTGPASVSIATVSSALSSGTADEVTTLHSVDDFVLSNSRIHRGRTSSIHSLDESEEANLASSEFDLDLHSTRIHLWHFPC